MNTKRRRAAATFERLADSLGVSYEIAAQDTDGYDVTGSGDFDLDTERDVEGSVRFDIDPDVATAAGADATALTGIIWGAGDHDLALGGKATPVRVPEETVRPTFEALKEDVAAGDVTLGFDHPGPDSVAAKTGIVDIGHAKDVGLAEGGQHIVLTDSELQNQQAAEAAEAGDFDDLDWSIVADVAVRRDQNGDVITEDGRVVLDATRITRIDAVDTGAVDAASIERGTDPLPDLQDETQMVQEAASNPNQRTQAAQALQASADAYTDTMSNGLSIDPDDVDDLEAARKQLSAAADIIDEQEDDLEAAQAKADGFQSLLQAHGLDADDYDTPQAAAQAVIDEQTEDIRAEIADLEADLAQYDVDDVDARAADLSGMSPDDLRNTLNARKAEAFDRQQKAQQKGRAAAKSDKSGRANFAGGSGSSGDQDADEIALSAMDGKDRIQASANEESPADYVQQEYGLDASQYDAADELHDDIMASLEGDA